MLTSNELTFKSIKLDRIIQNYKREFTSLSMDDPQHHVDSSSGGNPNHPNRPNSSNPNPNGHDLDSPAASPSLGASNHSSLGGAEDEEENRRSKTRSDRHREFTRQLRDELQEMLKLGDRFTTQLEWSFPDVEQ